MKSTKCLAVLTFVIPAFTALIVSLSGCDKGLMSKPLESIPFNAITINVRAVGAGGKGTTDDTWAFQKAIDSAAALGGGTVYVPPGTYLVDADTSACIKMKSNVYLKMVDTTRILLAKPNSLGRYNVIRMRNISNSGVTGGKIQGEREQHQGTTGEWGMGIGIYGCSDVTVTGTRIYDCWGDGISIAGTRIGGVVTPSTNCEIKGVVCKNNRRQGLSIGGVTDLKVLDSEFSNTHGTAPQCGIDVEPDAGQYTDNVLIQNCTMRYNAVDGILLYNNRARNIFVKNCEISDNYQRGIQCHAPVNTYIAYNNIHHNATRGITIEADVDSVTVVQNTLYQNHGYPARPATLYVTGKSSETAKDMYISPMATNVYIDANIYK